MWRIAVREGKTVAGYPGAGRIWEIDLLRGIAILLMVVFHLLYDLAEFYHFPIDYSHGLVYYTGKTSAALFILVAGASSSFSRNNLRRGLKVFSLGILIFAVTSVLLPGSNIIFGILQFLGVSMLLFPLYQKLPGYALTALGTAVLITGLYASRLTMPNNWLAPIGLLGQNFYSVDYYPVLPWFGVFLFGAALSKLLYKKKKSLFRFDLNYNPLVLLGRFSLPVYLAHQPLILIILFLMLNLPFLINRGFF
jgi:uncharacterized membrane protein